MPTANRMPTYCTLVVALLACSAAFGQQRAMTPAEVTALKEKIAASTQGLKALESAFEQTKHLDYLEHDVKSTGKLYFKSPDKIRWEYVNPTAYVVIFDNQKMHVYDGKTKKGVDLSSNRRLSGLNNLLVGTVKGGNIFDESQFDIAYYRNNTGYSATLIPKDKALAKYIKQVELAFDSGTFLVTRVKITDSSSDYTLISFNNQRKNASIPDEKFTMK